MATPEQEFQTTLTVVIEILKRMRGPGPAVEIPHWGLRIENRGDAAWSVQPINSVAVEFRAAMPSAEDLEALFRGTSAEAPPVFPGHAGEPIEDDDGQPEAAEVGSAPERE